MNNDTADNIPTRKISAYFNRVWLSRSSAMSYARKNQYFSSFLTASL